MSLVMLCSAFQVGNTAHENAVQTARLIEVLSSSSKSVELCIGTHEGQREISLHCTGFENIEEMQYYASQVLHVFGQQAVYMSAQGKAWLQHAGERADTELGQEVKGLRAVLAKQGWIANSDTEYLDRLVRGILPATIAIAA